MAPALVQSGSDAGERVVSLDRPVTIIGSKPDCDVHLDSPQVSGAHALLVTLRGRTYVRDLVSRTGVFVQDRRVQEALLRHGDRIRIAEFPFEFRAAAAGHAGGTAPGESGNHDEKVHPTSGPESLELVVEGYDAPPVAVEGPIFLIGRREGAELTLEDKRVSSAHAAIIQSGGRWHLYDLNSRYGTFVNETRTRSVALSPGDFIQLGSFRLRCQAARRVAAAAPAPPVAAPAPKAAPPPQVTSPTKAASTSKRVPAPKGVPAPTSAAPPPPPTLRAASAGPAVGARKPETSAASKPETSAAPPPPTPGREEQPPPPTTAPDAPAHAAEAPPGATEPVEPAIPAVPTPANPAGPTPAGPATLHLRIKQCRRCGYYLKPSALYCPACGKWRGRAYAFLAGILLALALLGALAAVWLPRLKLTAPPARLASGREAALAGGHACYGSIGFHLARPRLRGIDY